jgi:hypothetical protein
MIWTARHPRANMDMLGWLPGFLSEDDPDDAKKQLHTNYSHGGGWQPIRGYKLRSNDCLEYPGDPPLRPIFETKLRDERILVYEHAIVCVIAPDGETYECARMD